MKVGIRIEAGETRIVLSASCVFRGATGFLFWLRGELEPDGIPPVNTIGQILNFRGQTEHSLLRAYSATTKKLVPVLN